MSKCPNSIDVMCDVMSMNIDFFDKAGTLFVPDGQCPDMGKTIELFRRVCPDISKIDVISGILWDTSYWLSNGQWIAGDFTRQDY